MDAALNGPLAGRTALVTGAGSGIGQALCLAFAEAGAYVAVAVRRLESGEATAKLLLAEGAPPLVLEMDVTNPKAIEAGLARAAERFGGLDILVHNANNNDASALSIALERVDEAAWAAQGEITLAGAFHCARAGYPHLARSGRGRFVLMTSTFGYHGASPNPIYSAQKASYRAFIKSLAREWGPDRITVNAIAPAALTPPTAVFFGENPEIRRRYYRKFALGRMGDPREDIAAGAVALCGDALQFMTGQTLHLDGGLYPAA